MGWRGFDGTRLRRREFDGYMLRLKENGNSRLIRWELGGSRLELRELFGSRPSMTEGPRRSRLQRIKHFQKSGAAPESRLPRELDISRLRGR